MSEDELIYLIRCGNEWALELIFHEYYAITYGIAYSVIKKENHVIETEDVVGEVLSVFWQVLCGYRSDRLSNFHGYMKKCIRHKILTIVKRKYRFLKTEYVLLDDFFIEEDEEAYQEVVLKIPRYEIPDQIMIIKETKEEYNTYSTKVLSTREKDVYNCIVSGLSCQEISEKLNINIKSVYNTTYRVSKKMNRNNM